MNDSKNPQTYTKEEVVSILSRGLDRNHEGGRISHDELLETAREIGMTTLEIEAAVADEVRKRAERMALEEQQKRAVRGFLKHAIAFVVTSVLLVIVDVRLTGGVWWYFAIGAWGLGVGAHAVRVFGKKAPEPLPAATPMQIEVRGAKVELRGADDQRRSAGR